MPAPQAASAADELLVDALPEETREALRRLAAAGVLNEVLDAYPDDDEDDGCPNCGAPQLGVNDLVTAYKQGHAAAGAITCSPGYVVVLQALAEAGAL